MIFKFIKKTPLVLIKYLISIIGFGLIYYFYWLCFPDSFIINEQLNITPFTNNQDKGRNYDNLIIYQNKTDSLNDILHKSQKELSRLEIEQNFLKIKLDSLSKESEKIREQNTQKYINSSISQELLDSIKIIKEVINILEERKNNELPIAHLNLNLSRIEIKIATEKVNTYNYILENPAEFGDTILNKNRKQLNNHYIEIEYKNIPNLQVKIFKTQNEIDNLKYDFLHELTKKIDLIDFFLLSASNSSTVTYGEITPNHRLMRLLLFIQAVYCIYLLAVLIDKIKEN